MQPRLAFALMAVAAGCGNARVVAPSASPGVRVVQCRPATALPVAMAALDAPSAGSGDSETHTPNVGVDRSVASEGAAMPWTPYAIDLEPQRPAAATAAQFAESVIARRLPAIESCFAKSAATGSIRAMLAIDGAGDLTSARVGGLGDALAERCVAKALGDLRIVTSATYDVEVACDLVRGDAQPWRIAVDAGYGVIEAGRDQLRYGDRTLGLVATDPEPLADPRVFLVIVRPDTPGTMIGLALSWAFNGEGTLVALRDGDRPPVLLGAARSIVSVTETDNDSVEASLQLGAGHVTGCVRGGAMRAPVSDPDAVNALLGHVSAFCKKVDCAPSLPLSIDGDAVARDLVEVTRAARRAGFDRLVLGAGNGCAPASGTAAEP